MQKKQESTFFERESARLREEEIINRSSSSFKDALKPIASRLPFGSPSRSKSASAKTMFGQDKNIEPPSYQSETQAENLNNNGFLDSYGDDNIYEDNKTGIAESKERNEIPTVTQQQLYNDMIDHERAKYNQENDIAEQGNILSDSGIFGGHFINNPNNVTEDGQPIAGLDMEEIKEQQVDFNTENFKLDREPVRRAFYNDEITQDMNPLLNTDLEETIDNQINRALRLNKKAGFFNSTEKLEKERTMEERMGKINKTNSTKT
jgi:hypothetical protein